MATRYTIDEIAPLLALREREHLSLAELARRSGVPAETLRRWERQLSQENTSAFAAVDVVDDPEPTARDGSLRITIGGAQIDINGSVDRSMLASVVEVLLARC